MKRGILYSMIFSCSVLVQAQDMSYNQPWLAVIPGESSLAFGIPQRAVFSDVEGTPFTNEEFREGTLYSAGKGTVKGRFRFNAYTNEIEKEAEAGPVSLLRRDYYQVSIGNDLYLIEPFLNNGEIKRSYFVELNKGRVRLLRRESKEVSKTIFSGSSYRPERAARFKDEISYYLKVGSQPAVNLRLRTKDLLKAIPDHKKEVQAYIKDNEIRIKTVEDMLQVLAYYNSI